MATEVFVFSAWKSKSRRHSGSCGVLTVFILSQGYRSFLVLAFKVFISGTENRNLSLSPALANVFTCISPRTRSAGVLQHTHLPYHLRHSNDVIYIMPGFAQFLVSLFLPVGANKAEPMVVSVFLVRSSAGITCFSGVGLVCWTVRTEKQLLTFSAKKIMVQCIGDSLGVFQAAVSPGHWVTKLSLGKNLVSAICPHFPRLSACLWIHVLLLSTDVFTVRKGMAIAPYTSLCH